MWPDDEVRAALASLGREFNAECGGRPVRAANLHLTLAFVGDVSTARIPSLAKAMEEIEAAPFLLELDSCGYWRHNRIVWAGATQSPPALHQLVASLADRLSSFGFRREAREHVPHITLVRDARRAPRSGMLHPIAWPAREFALVQAVRRDGAVVYERLECRSLERAC